MAARVESHTDSTSPILSLTQLQLQPIDASLHDVAVEALIIVVRLQGRTVWPLPLCCKDLYSALPPLRAVLCTHLTTPRLVQQLTCLQALTELRLDNSYVDSPCYHKPQRILGCRVAYGALSRVFAALTQLRRLHLHCDGINQEALLELKKLAHLTYLVVRPLEHHPAILTWLTKALPNLTQLRHLDCSGLIQCASRGTDCPWPPELYHLTCLTHLGMPSLPPDIHKSLQRLPLLKSLTICGTREGGIDNNFLRGSEVLGLSRVTQLESLRLEFHRHALFAASSLGEVLPKLKNLSHLALPTYTLQPEDIIALSRLTYLENCYLGGGAVPPTTLCSLSQLSHLHAILTPSIDNQPLDQGHFMDMASAHLPHLTHLDVRNITLPYSLPHQREPSFPSLSSLTLSICQAGMTLPAWLATMTHLTCLRLHACDSVTDSSLEPLTRLPSLSHLELSSCCELQQPCRQVLFRLTSLRSLKIQSCGRLKDEGLAQLISLTTLSLDNCWSLPEVCVSELRHLTDLKKLELEQLSGLTDSVLLSVLPRMQELAFLRLAACKNLTTAYLAAVSCLKELEVFIIREVTYTPTLVSREEVQRVLESLPLKPHLEYKVGVVLDGGEEFM